MKQRRVEVPRELGPNQTVKAEGPFLISVSSPTPWWLASVSIHGLIIALIGLVSWSLAEPPRDIDASTDAVLRTVWVSGSDPAPPPSDNRDVLGGCSPHSGSILLPLEDVAQSIGSGSVRKNIVTCAPEPMSFPAIKPSPPAPLSRSAECDDTAVLANSGRALTSDTRVYYGHGFSGPSPRQPTRAPCVMLSSIKHCAWVRAEQTMLARLCVNLVEKFRTQP
jgi:hypothetical protein